MQQEIRNKNEDSLGLTDEQKAKQNYFIEWADRYRDRVVEELKNFLRLSSDFDHQVTADRKEKVKEVFEHVLYYINLIDISEYNAENVAIKEIETTTDKRANHCTTIRGALQLYNISGERYKSSREKNIRYEGESYVLTIIEQIEVVIVRKLREEESDQFHRLFSLFVYPTKPKIDS